MNYSHALSIINSSGVASSDQNPIVGVWLTTMLVRVKMGKSKDIDGHFNIRS